MSWRALGISVIALSSFGAAEARPVSYPGGWTVMQHNNGNASSLHVHYSPTFQDSIGYYAESNWAYDWTFQGVQYNRLLKRWNTETSQANLYVKAAAGVADPFTGGDESLAGFVEIAADWETRRWFTSYSARGHDMGFDRHFSQSARLGVAPYVGDFGDLHTWLMLEVQHDPETLDPVTLTPLVRFFRGVQLVELGYTPETDRAMFNWIIRF